jgi:hypothetical protein
MQKENEKWLISARHAWYIKSNILCGNSQFPLRGKVQSIVECLFDGYETHL